MPSEREWLRRLAVVQCVLGALFCLSVKFPLLSGLTDPISVAGFTVGACAFILWAPLSRRGDAKQIGRAHV